MTKYPVICYPNDAKRIKKAVKEYLHREVSLAEAEAAWGCYSTEYYCAGFLCLMGYEGEEIAAKVEEFLLPTGKCPTCGRNDE